MNVADYFGFFDGTGDTDTLYSMFSWVPDEYTRWAPNDNTYFLEVILFPLQDVSFIDFSFVSIGQLNELADGFMADLFKMKEFSEWGDTRALPVWHQCATLWCQRFCP